MGRRAGVASHGRGAGRARRRGDERRAARGRGGEAGRRGDGGRLHRDGAHRKQGHGTRDGVRGADLQGIARRQGVLRVLRAGRLRTARLELRGGGRPQASRRLEARWRRRVQVRDGQLPGPPARDAVGGARRREVRRVRERARSRCAHQALHAPLPSRAEHGGDRARASDLPRTRPDMDVADRVVRALRGRLARRGAEVPRLVRLRAEGGRLPRVDETGERLAARDPQAAERGDILAVRRLRQARGLRGQARP